MAEEQEAGEEKKSSKKLIIIIAVVLLLLGGGGAGAYFFFMKAPEDAKHAPKGKAKKGEHKEEKHEEEAKHEEEPKHEEEAKHDEHAAAEPDVYFEMPQPLLVNYPPGTSTKIIKISLTLLVKGESTIAVIKKHEPMIRNGLLMAISSVGAEKAKTLEGKQELRTLMMSEIAKVLEKMSGKNGVKELYFTEFVMQ